MMYKVQVRFLFHSDIKIKIPEIYDDSIFDDLFGILEDVNRKYNSYSENSYIDKINKNSGHFVKVDLQTIEILRKIIYLSKIIGGEYDITIMPLIRLWGFYKQNPVLPCFEEIKNALELYTSYFLPISHLMKWLFRLFFLLLIYSVYTDFQSLYFYQFLILPLRFALFFLNFDF